MSTTQGRGAVVGRAFGWGCVCGAVAGAVAGSVAIPVLGTAFGGAVGALVGAAFGIVNGMVLSALGPGATHGSARAVAALISAVCGVAAFAVVPPRNEQGRLLLDVGFVAVCAVIGALVGPAARFGLERKRPMVDRGVTSPTWSGVAWCSEPSADFSSGGFRGCRSGS